VAKSNHNKTEKRSEKIISWWRHHLRLDAAVRKQKSPYRHVDEDADTEVITLIFNAAPIEKTIPPFPFTVVGEEEIKLQCQKNIDIEKH
jgi:hypothetical protein